MKMMIGTGAMTNSFDDIEKAKTIILCGANPSENHPIPGARIKQAVLKNGTKLIVIDPRKTELTKYADVHLQLRPGTNILMFNALAHAIIDEGLDRSRIYSRRGLTSSKNSRLLSPNIRPKPLPKDAASTPS